MKLWFSFKDVGGGPKIFKKFGVPAALRLRLFLIGGDGSEIF
jgi:hypothetical protein